jgi:hypothetical protein
VEGEVIIQRSAILPVAVVTFVELPLRFLVYACFTRFPGLARPLQSIPSTHELVGSDQLYHIPRLTGETMKSSNSFVLALAVAALIALWAQPTSYSQDAGKQQGKATTQVQQQGKQQGQAVGGFDSDGDGIPNCQDPDYTRPQDGTGKQLGRMHRGGSGNANSQGCCGMGKGMGPRDGSGPRGQMGLCDGTGPKGKGAATK